MSERILPIKSTLVKYDEPIDASEYPEILKEKMLMREQQERGEKPKFCQPIETNDLVKYDLDEVLEMILPPRIWLEGEKVFIQKVSKDITKREDLADLGKKIEVLLKEREAKSFSTCPIRREIFSQVFDELIRQITIGESAERGVMLLRVRNELKMSLDGLEKLVESSTMYSETQGRLVDVVEQEYDRMEAKAQTLRDEVEGRKLRMDELEQKKKQLQMKLEERSKTQEEIQEKNVSFLKQVSAQIKKQIEIINNQDMNNMTQRNAKFKIIR